jgi:hypothetical protein
LVDCAIDDAGHVVNPGICVALYPLALALTLDTVIVSHPSDLLLIVLFM